jgi:nucleotide-binding universal stress UspA family protein
MYKHILIATDGSDLATKAAEQGLALGKALAAQVTVVFVTAPWSPPGDYSVILPIEDYENACADDASKILADVGQTAQRIGVACDTLHVKDRFAAEGIVETAQARGCDLIVMASHGRRGLTRLLLGSQANKVVTYSTVPVLICR